MLAGCGVIDVLVAYNLVGPNCGRMARLTRAYPACRFAVTADHAAAAAALSQGAGRRRAKRGRAARPRRRPAPHRRRPRPRSGRSLYATIARLPGLRPGGLHVYDGHNQQENFVERQTAALHALRPRPGPARHPGEEGAAGPAPCPRRHADVSGVRQTRLPGLELSPGTCFLHDHGYCTQFADMSGFTPAALLLTRVISRPTATRITLDLGTKAVASDPPAGQPLHPARRARLRPCAAKRGAFRRRNAGRRPLQPRRRGARHTHARLPHLRPAQERLRHRGRPGHGRVGDRLAGPDVDDLISPSPLSRYTEERGRG